MIIEYIIEFLDGVSTGGMILFILCLITGQNNLLRFVSLVCMSQISILATCLEPDMIITVYDRSGDVPVATEQELSFSTLIIILEIFWLPIIYFTHKRYKRMGWRTKR